MTQYYTLLSSLPRLKNKFKVEQTPISGMQLDKRLCLLEKDDKNLLYHIEWVLWKSIFMPLLSVSDIQIKISYISSKATPTIIALINSFLNVRSIIAALRIRFLNNTDTLKNEIDLCDWKRNIIKHWHKDDFNLSGVYPDITELVGHIKSNNVLAVEDYFLTKLWTILTHAERRHYFDFEAIVIYLIRWDIVDYWSQLNEVNVLQYINFEAMKSININ